MLVSLVSLKEEFQISLHAHFNITLQNANKGICLRHQLHCDQTISSPKNANKGIC